MEQTQFDENQAYFASIAETYDRLQPIVAGPAYDTGIKLIVETLVPYECKDPFQFVELGCGTATLTQHLLEHFTRSRGVAVDDEPVMLEIARRKLEDYDGRAEVYKADIAAYTLPACDAVLSSYAFHHISPESLTSTLARIASALQPGGCLILLDLMKAGPSWGKQVRGLSQRLYHRHAATAIADGRTTQGELDVRWAYKRRMKKAGKDIEHRHSVERLLAGMSEAGFYDVGLVWRMFAATIVVGFVPQAAAQG